MVMSDRIGVMRAGSLVQVGTPDEIYSQPRDKFVSEFMGDVNILKVSLDGKDRLLCGDFDQPLKAPAVPAGFTSGHLVVRPECMRFVARKSEADNVLPGRIYNEYALGSRIQYQVRAGDQVFVVEKLRQQAAPVGSDADVLVGWDARDSVLVGE